MRTLTASRSCVALVFTAIGWLSTLGLAAAAQGDQAPARLQLAQIGGANSGTPASGALDRPLKVATRVVPPLVVEENGKLTGFSIDLWEAIASRLSITSVYEAKADVRALLDSLSNGSADLGVAAISITSERDRQYDFSLPILDAGLQILVSGDGEMSLAHPLAGLLPLIFSPTLLVWLATAAVLIIVPAHLVWWLERRHHEGIIPTERYWPGIFHAMWWAASALVAQAEEMPRHWLSRVLALLWMFIGVVFVAFYTAQLTAALTVQEIRGSISGPDDLPGKKVATTLGSTAAKYVRGLNAHVEEVERIEEAYAMLEAGKVDAVVFDAPVLLSYAAHAGQGRVRVVGPVFRKEAYGIAMPPNSPLRRQIDATLLALREDGTYDRIYEKWFAGE